MNHQIAVDLPDQLVDRSPAVAEVGDHLYRYLWRECADALCRNTVVAGKDHCARVVQRRWVFRLPLGHPLGQTLKPSQRARRLGQLTFALDNLGQGLHISPRQLFDQREDFVETIWRRRGRFAVRHGMAFLENRRASQDPWRPKRWQA